MAETVSMMGTMTVSGNIAVTSNYQSESKDINCCEQKVILLLRSVTVTRKNMAMWRCIVCSGGGGALHEQWPFRGSRVV